MAGAGVTRDAEVLRALIDRIDQQDPHAFNNLGVLYHSKGLHAEAVDAFLRAIAIDPRMQTAVRNLEVAAATDGACDERLATLATCIARDPDDRTSAREQARLLRLIGRHTEAAQKLDALIAEDPDDAPSLLERGLLEQRAGDLRRAQRWLERATQADEADTFSRLHLAEVLYQRGQNEQALLVLDALLHIDGQLADAHLLRGFVLGDMGRHEAGMEATRLAASLNPSLAAARANLSLERIPADGPGADAQGKVNMGTAPMGMATSGDLAHYGLGLAFRQRGYFAEARQEFERALALGEDERMVRHAMAEVDVVTGQSTDAATTYELLLDTYGENARWRNEHGVAMHQAGNTHLAAESYRRALRCDPRYALAYANLGVALADMGDATAAREALHQAATIDPSLLRARLNLARVLARHRDPLSALSVLRELSSFHSTDAEVWHEMGLVLMALHRSDDAQQAFVAAIACRADFAEARYGLADALSDAGNVDAAEREREAAAQISGVRAERHLALCIELQRECPDAVGLIDLLALCPSGTLDEQPDSDDGESAQALLVEADVLAGRSLHAEALVRYQRARERCERAGPRQVWRRAALGEARCKCLADRGGEVLALLDTLLAEGGASDDDDAETLALLAAAHAAEWKHGRAEPRRARSAIARLMRLEPRSAALLHFVGNVALTLGNDNLALVLFRRALAVDPMRPSPRVSIARLLRMRDDLLAARLELAAALAVAPQLCDALIELARLQCATGRPADAVATLIGHLNRVPTDADALALLASALMSAGRETDARLALTRALRYDPGHAEALVLTESLLTTGGAFANREPGIVRSASDAGNAWPVRVAS